MIVLLNLLADIENQTPPRREVPAGPSAAQRGRPAGHRGAMRPISVPRFWASEGLTQAES